MPIIVRLCFCLLAAPALVYAGSPQSDESASGDQFDCLINPAVSGLVSCLPPEDHTAQGYRWDMGDGAVYKSDGSEPYIYHTYRKPGEYTVTLTINRGQASAHSETVLSIPEPLDDDISRQLARSHLR